MCKTGIQAAVLLILCLLPVRGLMADPATVIADGTSVKLRYTLKVDNNLVDSSTDKEPLQYTQGKSEILPELEQQLTGLKAGDKKTVTLQPDKAYGPVDPTAVMEVPIVKLPEGANKPGAVLSIQDHSGHNVRAVVKEIHGETAQLDLNHPLAGKVLEFDIEIIEVS